MLHNFFLSLLVSFILEHYTRECEFGNFDKIKNKNNTKTLLMVMVCCGDCVDCQSYY